ncbi:hypothetical protein NC653_004745 [Populus alba x Populus x berolinensis]|uniref:Uncharacterized protein n=1 Tax=Populus alba x Populus x berolinensis TaxID=444605 RepID=A0AAD6RVN8_9ROSI|nr:hypothetical protein NC653_004745 [Populus alba x Populus x berolinensis]
MMENQSWVIFGDNSKEMTVLYKVAENGNLMSNISLEQAYEISPYKGSYDEDEDEDDDDDDTENNKFIPSWASFDCFFPAKHRPPNHFRPRQLFPINLKKTSAKTAGTPMKFDSIVFLRSFSINFKPFSGKRFWMKTSFVIHG